MSHKKKFIMNTERVLNLTPEFLGSLTAGQVSYVMRSLTEINDKQNVIRLAKIFNRPYAYFKENSELIRKANPEFTHKVFICLLKHLNDPNVPTESKVQFIEDLIDDCYYLNLLLHSRFYIDLFIQGLTALNQASTICQLKGLLRSSGLADIVHTDNYPNLVYFCRLLAKVTGALEVNLANANIKRYASFKTSINDWKRLVNMCDLLLHQKDPGFVITEGDREFLEKELKEISNDVWTNDSIALNNLKLNVLLKNQRLNPSSNAAIDNKQAARFMDSLSHILNPKEGALALQAHGQNHIKERLRDFLSYRDLRAILDFKSLNDNNVILSNLFVIDLLFILDLCMFFLKTKPSTLMKEDEARFLLRSLRRFKTSIWDPQNSEQPVYRLIDALVQYLRSPCSGTIRELDESLKAYNFN